MTIKELIEKRQGLVAEMRKVNDAAQEREEGKRNLTADEQKKWDDFKQEVDSIKQEIDRRSQMEQIEKDLEAPINSDRRDSGEQRREQGTEETREQREQRVFQRYLRSGFQGLHDPNDAAVVSEMNRRAQQMDADVDGGYLVAPQQFVAELIKTLDNEVFVRQHARTFQLNGAHSMGAPSLDTDVEDADWTGEITQVSEGSLKVGKRELKPNLASKLVKSSMKLIANSALGVESIVAERMSYKFGVTHEKAFLTGSGAAQPLGVFTASNSGVPTSRDVSTGNTTTEIRFDGLKAAKYSLKKGHRSNARWLFSRSAVEQIDKLKDGEGRYLWQPATINDPEDRILSIPYDESEYAPDTFTTGLYVGILADWRHYWICDSLAMSITRLNELYQETNQIGWIGRLESDGMPVLSEAFARVKLA